jgi:hypothetical protein
MTDLPNSAMGVMRLLPDTKQGVEIFSTQLINAVKNGEVNPLQLKALFKVIEKVSEAVDSAIKENLLREAGKYSEKKFNAFGFEISKEEVGVKYDYSVCGDIEYERRHAAVESAKALMDERTAFLKALREPLELLNSETGEVYIVRPPLKKGAEGLKFSLK